MSYASDMYGDFDFDKQPNQSPEQNIREGSFDNWTKAQQESDYTPEPLR